MLTIILGVGAVCFRASTISIVPVLIAMLSNFVLPMRNVLTKKIMFSDSAAANASNSTSATAELGSSSHSAHGTSESSRLLDDAETSEKTPKKLKVEKGEGNPAESFYLTSLIAAYFFSPFWIACCILDYTFLFKIFSGEGLYYLMLSGFMHASYNLSSFGFLSRVSTPTTHAIANVFKRVFTIWSAVAFFGTSEDKMTSLTVFGLAISTIGLFWYGNLTASSKKA